MDVNKNDQKIVPNIWCNGTAEEQASFYAGVFRDTATDVIARYPEEGLPEFQQAMAGQALTVDVTVRDLRLSLINAGPEFRPNPSISMMCNFDPVLYDDAADYLEQVYTALVAGGRVLMELGEYPFSPKYAWIEDRWGVNWQLILTDPDGDPRPFLMPALMFGGAAQNRCREAVDHYIGLFPDSAWGQQAEYPAPTGPAPAGALMFSDFQLLGQWFVAMDSGVEQDFSFDEGVSLMVSAHGQGEIDAYWAGLSRVPEAEQCGWCKDEYGLSWQVVPDTMAELMARPDAYAHMMQMGKLEIDRF